MTVCIFCNNVAHMYRFKNGQIVITSGKNVKEIVKIEIKIVKLE